MSNNKKNAVYKISNSKNNSNVLERNFRSQTNKQLVSTKQALIKRKREELTSSTSISKTRPETNTINTIQSIVVCDRGTQCNRDIERSHNRFECIESSQFYKSLITDLRELIKDGKSEQIVNNVERVLYKAFSIDLGKTLSNDVEAMLLQSKLQNVTANLEATSRRLKETNETLHKEKDLLNSQVQKQTMLLREAHQKEEELRCIIKRLQNEIRDTEKLNKNNEKVILQLKKDKEKVIAQLNEETQNRLIAEQCAKIEKDKYQLLSNYKDKLLDELRSAMKELQSSAMEQFTNLKDTYRTEEDHDRVLFVDNEVTCLSTSPVSTNYSVNSFAWKDDTNTSFSEFSRQCNSPNCIKHIRKKDYAFIESSVQDKAESVRIDNIDSDLISLPNDIPPLSQTSVVFMYK